MTNAHDGSWPPPEVPVTSEMKASYGEMENIETHPAFVGLTISRCSGSKRLFGTESPDLGLGFYSLKLQEVERCSGQGSDRRYFAKKTIAEVEMSPAQFIRMVTNTNTSLGTPATLRYLRGEGHTPKIPWAQEQDHERIKRETVAKLRKLSARAEAANKEIQEILQKGSKMKGPDRDRIADLTSKLVSDFAPNNVGFAVQLIQEAAEEVVTEAQANADAAIQMMLADLGERALAAGARLPLPEDVRLKLLEGE